ncbi:MAG: polysaccharide export protein [Acidiferrobacterales bacterium]|nr:polysaccharide export protein [Acidiferrobacterales bacterium]
MNIQKMKNYLRVCSLLVVLLGFGLGSAFGQSSYLVQSGDSLLVSVWNEPDLTNSITIHPDGTFSMPLIGEIQASQKSVSQIKEAITEKLIRYIPDAIVTVGIEETVGVNIYVIGQVNTPGVFNVQQPTDVMQALSLAQGMTPYAAKNKIKILRRGSDGQKAIGFRYGDVAKGLKLEQNIVLENGDVVVVP